MPFQSIPTTRGEEHQSSFAALANPVLLFVAAIVFWFPFFNLDMIDKTGAESLPLISATKIARIAWCALCLVLTSFLAWRMWRNINLRQRLLSLGPVLVALSVAAVWISLFDANPLSPLGAYRALEYSSVALGLILLFVTVESIKTGSATTWMFTVLYWTGLILALVAFVAIIFDPNRAVVEVQQARWRLGGHLWSEGFVMIQALSLFMAVVFRYLTQKASLWQFAGITLISFVLLFLTDSRIGILLLLFSVASVIALCLTQRKLKAIVILLVTTLLAAGTADGIHQHWIDTMANGDLEDLRDKNASSEWSTLNGRTPLFKIALQGIEDHWINGVGYVEGERHYIDTHHAKPDWRPSNAHNGFLDLLLSLGVLGALPTYGLITISLLVIGTKIWVKNMDPGCWLTSTLFLSILIYANLHSPFGNLFSSTYASFIGCTLILTHQWRST